MPTITKIGLAGMPGSRIVSEAINRASAFLKENKTDFVSEKGLGLKGAKTRRLRDFDCDLVLAFGGDGTLLRVFRELGPKRIPVMGVNCGELGFLMDLDYTTFTEHLSGVLEGKYRVEERSRLAVSGCSALALNECVIAPKKPLSFIRYSLSVEGEHLWRDSADGVIISTPTGSTAHALSAGGPIVSWSSKVFVIVSLNSTNPAHRPLVVPDEAALKISEINGASSEIIIDGQQRFHCAPSVSVKKSAYPALLARVTPSSYSALSQKMRKKTEAVGVVSLKDVPPSARFVYRTLEFEGPLTQKELVEATTLPARTLRRALEALIAKGVVIKKPFLEDPRQSLYYINE